MAQKRWTNAVVVIYDPCKQITEYVLCHVYNNVAVECYVGNVLI